MVSAGAAVEHIQEGLTHLNKVLAEQVDEERLGGIPKASVLEDAHTTLAELQKELHGIEQEASVWAEVDSALVPGLRVAREHLQIVGQSLERAQAAAENPHETLHLLRDAIFHAERCIEEIAALEDDALHATRVVSREENRREFMAG